MSIIKLAISSAPARLAMQKTIIGQAGAKAGALYSAASSKAASGVVNKGLLNQLKATGVQRADPLLNNVTKLKTFQPLSVAK